MKEARLAYFNAQPDLDADCLVYVDEIAATNMCAAPPAPPRGRRRPIAVPQAHYKTTTVTAALRTLGPLAIDLKDGATTGAHFKSYIAALAPQGDTVILDNLPAHKVAGVRDAIERVGAPSLPSALQPGVRSR